MSLDYYGVTEQEDHVPFTPGLEQRHMLATSRGRVESMLCKGRPDTYGVVLGHPHPMMGGNMDNNVVMALARELQQRGVSTIRFDFTRADCKPDDWSSLAECHIPDLMAADQTLRQLVPCVAWCGYSYSSAIMAQACRQQEKTSGLQACCYVSPPTKMARIDEWWCSPTDRAIKVFVGTNDTFFDRMKIDHGIVEMIQGADHFWSGFEHELAKRVADYLDVMHYDAYNKSQI